MVFRRSARWPWLALAVALLGCKSDRKGSAGAVGAAAGSGSASAEPAVPATAPGAGARAGQLASSALFGEQPQDIPVFASADGKSHVVVMRFDTLECDPEDTHDEGICDFRVRMAFRGQDGSVSDEVTFVMGKWKAKSDFQEIDGKLAAGNFRASDAIAPRDPEDRSYHFSGDRQLIIDGYEGRVRARVVHELTGKLLHNSLLPESCEFRGKNTVWGAEVAWFADVGQLFIKPRACKGGQYLELVELEPG